MQHVDEHAGVHELVRVQHPVRVPERSLQTHGAGGRIDLVVDRHQRSRRDLRSPLAIVRIDGNLAARAEAPQDRLQAVFGYAEHERDRLELGDDDEAARVGRLDDVARIDQPQADATGDRRRDPAVRELQLDRVDLPHVHLDGRFGLVDDHLLRVELLPGDHFQLSQPLIALEIEARVREIGLIARELPFRLRELRLEGAGIDLG